MANYIIAPLAAETYNTRVLQPNFHQKFQGLGKVERLDKIWRLSIPAGKAGTYRLAQIDDYAQIPRKRFPHKSGVNLKLRARASSNNSPGTWGFGFWNDPFAGALGFGGLNRLPALPNAAWFFFPSSENYLSLSNNQPARQPYAGVYSSNPLTYALAPIGILLLPLLLWPPTSRSLRSLASNFMKQDSLALSINVSEWHSYEIHWRDQSLSFLVDGELILQSQLTPRPPLGLVIWLDNQFAAWRPNGEIEYGTLANQDSHWIEIADIELGL